LFYTFFAVSTVLFMFPIAVLVPFLAFFWIDIRPAKWWIDHLESGWFTFTWWMIEKVMNTNMFISGDEVPKGKKERVLVITNHRTRLDWMFLWGFFLREGRLRHLKIVMKAMLKQVPGFGWPMQTATFIFLARDFEKDKHYVESVLKYLGRLNYPAQTLLFPEGTDKTNDTTKRSDTFAQKSNLKPLRHALHPRTTGFTFIVGLMKKYGLIDAVYDLTLGYMGPIPQNESAIFKGFPTECHVHLKRYDINDLPSDDQELGEWLRTKWYEKDDRLEKFYQNFKFEPEHGQPETEKRTSLYSPQEIQSSMTLQAFLWIGSSLFLIYLFLTYSAMFWFFILSWVALTLITIFGGGLDLIEIDYWAKRLQKKES